MQSNYEGHYHDNVYLFMQEHRKACCIPLDISSASEYPDSSKGHHDSSE